MRIIRQESFIQPGGMEVTIKEWEIEEGLWGHPYSYERLLRDESVNGRRQGSYGIERHLADKNYEEARAFELKIGSIQ